MVFHHLESAASLFLWPVCRNPVDMVNELMFMIIQCCGGDNFGPQFQWSVEFWTEWTGKSQDICGIGKARGLVIPLAGLKSNEMMMIILRVELNFWIIYNYFVSVRIGPLGCRSSLCLLREDHLESKFITLSLHGLAQKCKTLSWITAESHDSELDNFLK